MMSRLAIIILGMLCTATAVTAQATKLIRAAQHKTCVDMEDTDISDCTDQWMSDFLAVHIDTTICVADDSTTRSYRLSLQIDDRGQVLDTKAYSATWEDSLDVCPGHIQEQLQQLVGSKDFIPGASIEGAMLSRKHFAMTTPALIDAVIEADSLYKVVEQMPHFVGCEDLVGNEQDKKMCGEMQMLLYVYRNLKYPSRARENAVQGMVVVQFIVDTTGMIDSIKVVRDIGAGCGESARSMVQSMNALNPPFVPGMQGGKAVRVQYTLPVRYKLEGGRKKRRKRR